MISTVLFVITALLFVAEKSINPWDHYLSFGDKFHVSIWDLGGRDSRIAFFSNGEYGPYRGSMIGFVGADGKLDPPLKRKEGFGDSWGIYYRLFEWHDASLWPDTKLWTLMVSLWYPMAAFAVMPSIGLWRWIKCRSTSSA